MRPEYYPHTSALPLLSLLRRKESVLLHWEKFIDAYCIQRCGCSAEAITILHSIDNIIVLRDVSFLYFRHMLQLCSHVNWFVGGIHGLHIKIWNTVSLIVNSTRQTKMWLCLDFNVLLERIHQLQDQAKEESINKLEAFSAYVICS